MLHTANIPILMHFLLEFWAIKSFLQQPGLQLHEAKPSREAVLVCQSYAGTLLTLNIICFAYFLSGRLNSFDGIGAALTWALSTYHIFPMYRAWDRMKRRRLGQNYKPEYDIGGGPAGNFRGHCILFLSLVAAGTYGLM